MCLSAHNSAWYVTGDQQNAAWDGDGDEDVPVERAVGTKAGPYLAQVAEAGMGLGPEANPSQLVFFLAKLLQTEIFPFSFCFLVNILLPSLQSSTLYCHN